MLIKVRLRANPNNIMKTSQDIRKSIKDGIKGGHSDVQDRVVSHYTEQEIKRRSDLIIKGLDKLETLEEELSRIKPDASTYNEKQEVIQEAYSKAQSDKLKKAKDSIEKLSKPLNAAIENGNADDYDKLEKALK